MELFEIGEIQFDRKRLVVEVYGYTFSTGYHGKSVARQRMVRFYYTSVKSRLFTQHWLSTQKQAKGCKTVIEGFQALVGTKVLIPTKMMMALD